MSLNKKSVDDINVKGKRVLVRCDFNVPLKDGKITDDNRIKGALPTIQKLIKDGGKVILCSHLGKVKNGPNEGESLAPVAVALEAALGQKVTFVNDDNVTDRWQRFTEEKMNVETLDKLSKYCSEFLIHAVDVEGKQNGIEEELVKMLGEWGKIPITYAGGVGSFKDLDKIYNIGNNKLNVTVGSALDIFGGDMSYKEVIDYCLSTGKGV